MIRTTQKYGTVVVTEMDGESAGLIELRLQQKDWAILSVEEVRTVAKMLNAAARRVSGRRNTTFVKELPVGPSYYSHADETRAEINSEKGSSTIEDVIP